MTKHDIERQLAGLATGGVIVEIGNGVGNGLLALHAGNAGHLPIYGIDSYQDCVDLLGGVYGPHTEEVAAYNTQHIPNLTRIKADAAEAARDWRLPVALLWFDISLPYEQVRAIITTWEPHVIPGGLIGLAGYCYPQLGAPQVAAELWQSGQYERLLPEQGLVAVLRKATEPEPKRAAFYIASNEFFAKEAAYSAESVQRCLGIDTTIFASYKEKHTGAIQLQPPKYKGWYRNQVLYLIEAFNTLHQQGYDQLLYLDTDTYVCRICRSMFKILDNYDMAFGHAAGRGATPTAVNCPPEFATLGVGVNLMRNTPKVRGFLADWLAMFEAHYDTYGETDEGPFRDLLFLNKHGLSYYVLAPEEHCRFGFGVWLNGAASILHGRVDRPLAEVAAEINAVKTMRLYRYGDGMLWWHRPGG